MSDDSPDQKIRVIIFGTWGNYWMSALDPSSALWVHFPQVKEVILADETSYQQIQPDNNPHTKTVILPLMEWHIIFCPREHFSLISEESVIQTLGIKNQFAAYMKKIGLPQFCPSHYESMEDIQYPAVIKRANKNGSSGISIVESEEQLKERLREDPWKDHQNLAQEFIPGDKEYVTHLICKDGEIKWHASFCHSLVNAHTILREDTLIDSTYVTTSEVLLKLFETILKPLNFNGPCNIDFKFNAKNELKIFEINPRFGGSLMAPDKTSFLKEAMNQVLIHAHDQNVHPQQ